MNTTQLRRLYNWRVLVTITLLLATAYVLVVNADKLRASLRTLRAADPWLVLLAFGLMFVTYFLAALVYQVLAIRPLRYLHTLSVEVAAAAVNRVLPAGVAGLGLIGLYLHRQKHTAAQATAMVAANNLLGIVAHLLMLAGISLAVPSVWSVFAAHLHLQASWSMVVVAGLLLALFFVPVVRRPVARFFRHIGQSLHGYLRTPQKIVGAIAIDMLLTVAYTGVLYLSVQALGIHLPPVQCFVVFSIGMLAATVTPTPGGLVGAETGLYAGFSAYGLSSPNALAATLLFRLLTAWLPVLPGLAALLLIRAKKLV